MRGPHIGHGGGVWFSDAALRGWHGSDWDEGRRCCRQLDVCQLALRLWRARDRSGVSLEKLKGRGRSAAVVYRWRN